MAYSQHLVDRNRKFFWEPEQQKIAAEVRIPGKIDKGVPHKWARQTRWRTYSVGLPIHLIDLLLANRRQSAQSP